MNKVLTKKWLLLSFLFIWVVMARMLSGCSAREEIGDKVRDLEFTVVGETEIPDELKQIISEKKASSFKLTYSNDQNLYIVVGYGQQQSGGYSITVDQLYLTKNSIVLDTELIGPQKGETAGADASYPYIVIKTEYSEIPVVFQ